MSALPLLSLKQRHGKRVSRLVGKIWLVVLFFLLFGMSVATGMIVQLFGSMASICTGVLVVSVVWSGMLLAAIGCNQGWARYVLSGFLFCFVIVQILFVAGASRSHPLLQDEAGVVVVLMAASNIFAAVFLLTSSDIRHLSRRGPDSSS